MRQKPNGAYRSVCTVALWLTLTSAAVTSATAATSSSTAPHPLAEPPSEAVLIALRSLRVELLTSRTPPVFRLFYSGPITRLSGPLCYSFAGYSETCTDLSEPWLTPAAAIELYAPGGVPMDLLAGYRLLVRFPHWTEETFMPHHTARPAPTP